MTKKRVLIGIIAAAVIICATLAIIIEKNDKNADTVDIDLYFFNETGATIVAEHRSLSFDDGDELEDIVLNKLMDGPSDSKNKPIFDSGVKIRSTIRNGTDMTVNFSKKYLTDDTSRNLLATYAIVKSLCQIRDIDRVMVTVEGKEIVSSDGTAVGFLSAEDIDLPTDSMTQDSKELVLYFADKNTDKLISEKRTIKITDTIAIEQYIVNELIKGTQNANARNIISADTELLSAQTTDGTCFVNFKSGFVEKNSGDAVNERLVIYSVVDSLCRLDNVHCVQFLVDGKKIDKFGDIDLSGFFEENRYLLK